MGRTAFVPVSPVFAVTLPTTVGPTYGGLLGNVLALVAALLGAPPAVETYRVNGNLIFGTPWPMTGAGQLSFSLHCSPAQPRF